MVIILHIFWLMKDTKKTRIGLVIGNTLSLTIMIAFIAIGLFPLIYIIFAVFNAFLVQQSYMFVVSIIQEQVYYDGHLCSGVIVFNGKTDQIGVWLKADKVKSLKFSP